MISDIQKILRKVAPTNVEAAALLGVHASNLSNWCRDGHIPWKHRFGLLRIAEERGFKDEVEPLLAGTAGQDAAA